MYNPLPGGKLFTAELFFRESFSNLQCGSWRLGNSRKQWASCPKTKCLGRTNQNFSQPYKVVVFPVLWQEFEDIDLQSWISPQFIKIMLLLMLVGCLVFYLLTLFSVCLFFSVNDGEIKTIVSLSLHLSWLLKFNLLSVLIFCANGCKQYLLPKVQIIMKAMCTMLLTQTWYSWNSKWENFSWAMIYTNALI